MIVALDHQSDATWYFSVVMVWSCTEISVAIIALSLPGLRALFGFLREKGRSNLEQDSSDISGSGNLRVRSVPPSSKRRIFDGPDIYETTVDINHGSASQEALCKMTDEQKIRIMDTVRVDVHQKIHR